MVYDIIEIQIEPFRISVGRLGAIGCGPRPANVLREKFIHVDFLL